LFYAEIIQRKRIKVLFLENFFLARQVFTYLAWERHVFACYPFFFLFILFYFIWGAETIS
jgi:hypothetical protein